MDHLNDGSRMKTAVWLPNTDSYLCCWAVFVSGLTGTAGQDGDRLDDVP